VSGTGDVNGDGVDDLLIGSMGTRSTENLDNAGASYVVFGGDAVGSTGVVDLSGLDGTDGFVINGVDPGDVSGRSVSGAGDVNGDGVGDLLIGAPSAGGSAGASYLVFGGRGVGGTGVLELSDLEGADGTVFKGIDQGDVSGESVSGAGDVNGDGVDDLLIGASGGDPNRDETGETYVVFGVAANRPILCDGRPVTVDLNLGETPTNGDDVILGRPVADRISALDGNDTVCGAGGDDIINAGRGDDRVKGGPGNDIIRGGLGDDRLDGEAGDDSIQGSPGDDTIDGGTGVDDIDGGAGDDTIATGPGATVGTGASVSGGSGGDVIHGGRDADDIRGNSGADFIRGGRGGDRINGGPGRDSISGDSGNDVLNGGMDDDVVRGGAGNDLVLGDRGDDVVLGGGGTDACRGGEGTDTASTSCEITFDIP